MQGLKTNKVYHPCKEALPSHSRWIGTTVDDITKSDVLLLTGLSSLSTKYNNLSPFDKDSTFMFTNEKEDLNDLYSLAEAHSIGKPIVGINKGLHVMHSYCAGGFVYHMQHPEYHDIYFEDGFNCIVNSYHCQMVSFDEMDKSQYKVLAYGIGMSPFHLDHNYDNFKNLDRDNLLRVIEPEIVYYPEINALGFQYDIYSMYTPSTALLVGTKLVNLLINNQIKDFIEYKVPIVELMKPTFSMEKYKLNKQIQIEEQNDKINSESEVFHTN